MGYTKKEICGSCHKPFYTLYPLSANIVANKEYLCDECKEDAYKEKLEKSRKRYKAKKQQKKKDNPFWIT